MGTGIAVMDTGTEVHNELGRGNERNIIYELENDKHSIHHSELQTQFAKLYMSIGKKKLTLDNTEMT